MLRKAFCALLFVCAGGVAVAEEFIGGITKVDGNKAVTVQEMAWDKELKKPGKPIGEPVVMAVAKDVKVFKGAAVAGEGKDIPFDDGLQNKLFKELPENQITLFARITRDDKKTITKIVVFSGVAPAKKKSN